MMSKFKGKALAVLGTVLVLGGCSVVPNAGPGSTGPSDSTMSGPEAAPDANVLPSDAARHRVALLVPLTGPNANVGQSIANATTMALLDTNADNLRITTYDTGAGAGTAAARAVSDGNELILGPLMGDNVPAVVAQARPADIPIITFSNDVTVASRDVFVMGHIPAQSIEHTVFFARSQGKSRFAALIPDGEYGRRAELALNDAVRKLGGSVVAIERYDRGNTSIRSAAERLKGTGGYDAVLIADGPRLAAQGAAGVKGSGDTRILGTELWSGESSVAASSALNGAWFSAVTDARYRTFYSSYETRFGSQPFRIATLGYDAVLLTLKVSNAWPTGRDFPTRRLREDDGFLGIDGTFRFSDNGLGERLMEVREVRGGDVVVVQAADIQFDD